MDGSAHAHATGKSCATPRAGEFADETTHNAVQGLALRRSLKPMRMNVAGAVRTKAFESIRGVVIARETKRVSTSRIGGPSHGPH